MTTGHASASWMPAPQPVPAPAPAALPAASEPLPTRVRVYEVGPRDGLQAEPDILPTRTKIEFCRRLLAAGVGALEVTSFVPPRWIPQLADAEQVIADVAVPNGVRSISLVPNLRGLERALAAGVREVAVVASVTESFAAANLNTTVRGALDRAAEVVSAASDAGVPVRGYLSMAFGDPWEGPVDADRMGRLAGELSAMGCGTVALGDTIGVGTPGQVVQAIDLARTAGVPIDNLALHFHDTYGQALANVHAALGAGVTEFDSSAGGLGRCPYAKGATGNLATEDLVWMLHGLGIETGLDLHQLVTTSQWMAVQRGRPGPSRVVAALTAAGVTGSGVPE